MSIPGLPSSIRLVEVGLRDGLQSVPAMVPTAEKVELVHLLIDAGVREIEAVSFAHPKVLPQLADAAEVAPDPRPGDAAPDTIYVTGSDGGFEAILIACDNPALMRSVTAPFDARLRGADRG